MSFNLALNPTNLTHSLFAIEPSVKNIELQADRVDITLLFKSKHAFPEHFLRPVVIQFNEQNGFGMTNSTSLLEKQAEFTLSIPSDHKASDHDTVEILIDFSLKNFKTLDKIARKEADGPFMVFSIVTSIYFRSITKGLFSKSLKLFDTPTLIDLKKKLIGPKEESPLSEIIMFSYELPIPPISPKPFVLTPPTLGALYLDVLSSDFILTKITANFLGSYRFF